MTVHTDRENAANGDVDGAASAVKSTAPSISIKGSSKNARFPGVGRTLSGGPADDSNKGIDEGENEEAEDEEYVSDNKAGDDDKGADEGSDFDEEAYDSEDDDADNDDYSSGEDDEDDDEARGGSSVYNLRSPALKRKFGSSDSEDEDTGPSLRTRQKMAVSYNETFEGNASGSEVDEEPASEDED
ncbi:hypothetical protein EV175_004838 [Coemansia sp. RSA 1933]|nr:hypothetical protein EV175_004838 [Coemansia sp. RSA 1933]